MSEAEREREREGERDKRYILYIIITTHVQPTNAPLVSTTQITVQCDSVYRREPDSVILCHHCTANMMMKFCKRGGKAKQVYITIHLK